LSWYTTEYAIKTCHQPLIPIYCNQWVRQVGVLSPYLFAVYLDELSDQPEWDALWEIWLWTICLLMIYVFSPSISGLQCLLDICVDYAAQHEIAWL